MFINPFLYLKIALSIVAMFVINVDMWAQISYSAKILDEDTNLPIPAVVIRDIKNNNIAETDSNGKFIIITNGNIEIIHIGYITKYIAITDMEPSTIYLKQKSLDLSEIVINTSNIPQKQKKYSQAVSIISKTTLKSQNSHDLSAVLNTVPGVFMQSGTLNTNRITIRGIGARNLFGTANIRAYYGDIPLTDGNGESSIEDLELNSLANITILKGPSSSTFGVGLGGTIILTPKFGETNEHNILLAQEVGSLGFKKSTVELQMGFKNTGSNITYSDTHSDGFRDNNRYNRRTFTLASKILLGDENELTLIGSNVQLNGGIPSSLSKSDFLSTPQKAAFTWGQAKAYEDLSSTLIGLNWKHHFNDRISLINSFCSNFKNNYEPRPFNILKEKSNNINFRSRVVGKYKWEDNSFDFSAGGELFYELYRGETFENLYQEYSDNRGSVEGNQLTGFNERRRYYNVFLEGIYSIGNDLNLNFGANLNDTFFRVKDSFKEEEINNNGSFNFKPIISPRIGYNYIINPRLINYGNISHGFSPPTTAETLLPDGIFNPSLKPEKGWNFETGIRYNLMKNRLYGSIAIFKNFISDLLVSRRTQEDDFFAINAGKARNNGIESELNVLLYTLGNNKLLFNSGISISDFRFTDFYDLDENYSGNKVAGVPDKILNLQLLLQANKGLYGRLAYQNIGEMAVNDANTQFSDGYNLFSGKIGFITNLFKYFELDVHFSANNILNEKYASQLQINAIGFGSNEPRFYYPGQFASYYFGIVGKYTL